MARFTLPRDIYYGVNSLQTLKTIKGKKAIIITRDDSLKQKGFIKNCIDYLEEAGIETSLFEGIEPDPSVDTVNKGAAAMLSFEPDWIIAIGGGATMDAAKAMWIFYEYPNISITDIKDPFAIPELRTKAKFIAIPTTSGTASEVSAFSIITDYDTKIRYPLTDYEITPDIAILDPALAQLMTPETAAYTGMDAFTHALEAYVAALSTPITDTLALKAMQMINYNLVNSYKKDKKAREDMHIAQCMAGMAFSNALLGIVHSMSHKTSGVLNVHHGFANAIYLPYVIDYNKSVCGSKYAEVANQLGLEGKTEDQLISSLKRRLNEINKSLNIPLNLKDLGVDEKFFFDNLDKIAENAESDACTGANPRRTTNNEFKKLFTSIYYGNEVDY